MPKLNEDYLYQSGEMKLEILLDDNGFQEVLNERKTFSEEDKFLIEYLQLMVRYDMSYTKHFFNIEYHRERHMILPKKGWIHISPSLRAISNNRFEPIPMGYPEWFIIMFSDVILWASYNDGNKFILNWLEDLENNKKIELVDPETNKFTLFILEEMIKKYLWYHKYLECSRVRV
jgi:hypothetical protein